MVDRAVPWPSFRIYRFFNYSALIIRREIDGKAYEAYVKPKEEAKNIYNQAQSQGQSAGLVELK